MRRVGPLLFTALLTACGGAVGDDQTSRPLDLAARPAAETRLVGGKPRQRALLAEILRAMGPTSIAEIRIAEPVGWEPYDPGDVALVVRAPADDRLAEWQGHVVGGVFRDRSRALGLPGVVALSSNDGGMSIAGAPWDEFDPIPAGEADAVAETLHGATAEARAEVDELEIARPAGLAIVVRLRVEDPSSFLRHGLVPLLDAAGDRFRDFEGMFVEVVDSDGKFVLLTANASRLSWGMGGTAPEFAGCSPFTGLGTVGTHSAPSCRD